MIRALLTPHAKADRKTKELARAIIIAAVVSLWLCLPRLVSSPLAILAAIPKLWSEEAFGQELWTSLVLNLQSAGLMIVISLAVAYGATVQLLRPVAAAFSMGRFNSFVGLPFLLTLLIGDAHWIKVTLLAMAMSFFSVPAITDVINTIPKESMDDARVVGMGAWRVLWEVVILGKFHDVMDVLRTNMAMGWCLLPMVEGLFRSEGGVGVLLLVENKYLRLDYVYAILLLVGLAGIGSDRLILGLKHWVCPYAFIDTEAK